MKKLAVAFFLIFAFSCFETSAGITLMAITHPGKASVTLQWNMVDYPGTTTYTLFKSIDGVVWEITAANPAHRNYTSSTILAYKDNFSDEQKLYYRVKVYDANENIVDMSNTAVVENPKNISTVENMPEGKNLKQGKPLTTRQPAMLGRNVWQLYPNPVGNMLNLSYKGKERLKGVVNIIIQDATGKAIVRYRAASNNKQVHLPVENLHAGLYFIKINVSDEIQLNDKFVKE
jgi:hypothetical protein